MAPPEYTEFITNVWFWATWRLECIQKSLELRLVVHFLYNFLIRIFLKNHSISRQSFIVVVFFSPEIFNKKCFQYILGHLLTSQNFSWLSVDFLTRRVFQSTQKKLKRKYLENEKRCSDETKTLFIIFEGLSNESIIKIADAGFNQSLKVNLYRYKN